MIVTTMAVTESPSSNTACGGATTRTSSHNLQEDDCHDDPHNPNNNHLNDQDVLKPLNTSFGSYSEIDRLLDASYRGRSGSMEESETEGYEFDTLEPVPPPSSAEFMVDLSRLTPNEATSLVQHTKENGEKQRNENAKSIQQLQQTLSTLQDKLQRKLAMTSMATYTQAVKMDVSGGSSSGSSSSSKQRTMMRMPMPTYVLTNQTQLCRAFHVQEVYMNQIKRMQKKNKKLLSFYKKQIKLLQEENNKRAAPLQAQVATSQQEVVRMCRILEIDPDDWKPVEDNELIKRVSEVFNGVQMLGEWARSFSESTLGQSTRSMSQSTRTISEGSK